MQLPMTDTPSTLHHAANDQNRGRTPTAVVLEAELHIMRGKSAEAVCNRIIMGDRIHHGDREGLEEMTAYKLAMGNLRSGI